MDESTNNAERVMWIFACYDHDRVSAMSLFSNTAQYFSEEHAIDTVRSRFSIPETQIVNFIQPQDWHAPNVLAAATSFDVDMQKVNRRIIDYLASYDYESADVMQALTVSSAIPNPTLGILLICVDLQKLESAVKKQKKAPKEKKDKCVYCGKAATQYQIVFLYKDTFTFNRKVTETLPVAVPYCLDCEEQRKQIKKADENFDKATTTSIVLFIMGPILFVLAFLILEPSDKPVTLGLILGLGSLLVGYILYRSASAKHKLVDRTGIKTTDPYSYAEVRRAIKSGWTTEKSQ